MKRTTPSLQFFFISSLMAILIWLASPMAKAHANIRPFASPYNDQSLSEETFPFKNYEARYKVTWRGIQAGVSKHRLTQTPKGSYFFEAQTTPSLGFLPYRAHETTQFIWEEGRIKPLNYQYDIHEGKHQRAGHIAFDWAKYKISSLNPKDPFEYAIEDDFQDKLTHILMLRRDLQRARTKDLYYTVAVGDKTRGYEFFYKGEEEIQTSMGKLKAIKLETTTHQNRVTTLWFASDLHFLPVKITHARAGKILTSAEITSFNVIS